MPKRKRNPRSLAEKTAELAIAAPQVVAHRLLRMAGAGTSPSARDQREFQRMGNEKTSAFFESWNAMALQGMRSQQALTTAFMRALLAPPSRSGTAATKVAAQMQSAALDVIDKGITPIHRRAVANAKRLGRTRAR